MKRGPDFRPLYNIPFMFEAREFLRKKLVGHQVQITVYYVLPARLGPSMLSCSTMLPSRYTIHLVASDTDDTMVWSDCSASS